MMSGAFSLVNVLADSVGPGTVGFNNEPQDFFMISSLLCMAMILLHTFWGVIAFDAWEQRKYLNMIYVWASHLTVSCLVSTVWTVNVVWVETPGGFHMQSGGTPKGVSHVKW